MGARFDNPLRPRAPGRRYHRSRLHHSRGRHRPRPTGARLRGCHWGVAAAPREENTSAAI